MIHPLLVNAERTDQKTEFHLPMDPVTFVTEGINTAITRYILANYSDAFNDVDFLMTGPSDLVLNQAVTAMSKPLQTKYDLQVAAELSELARDNVVETIIAVLAEELAAELFEIQDTLLSDGKFMCPYELVVAYKGVNHNTFEPEIRFRTRYGIYTPES